jgi:hypothetical protein
MNNIYAFSGTFAFLPTHRAKQTNAKEPSSQRIKNYQVDGQHHDRKKRRTANSVYVAIAGVGVNRSSVLLGNFVLNGQVSASNPLLHIHAKRHTSRKQRILHTFNI